MILPAFRSIVYQKAVDVDFESYGKLVKSIKKSDADVVVVPLVQRIPISSSPK